MIDPKVNTRITITPLAIPWLIALAILACAPASAATRQDFIEAAKKDREVAFYTTTNLEEAGAMTRHFKAKYPFLEVNINRAEGERIITKVLQETRAAQKSFADVIQTPAFYLHALQ